MNPHRITKGMSKGSKKGNASAAIIVPTITKHPNTIMPIPAKTNTKSVAAQKSAINATTSPPTPIASFNGPVTCSPLITIVTMLCSRSSPHATITSINTARAIASFFAIRCFAGPFLIFNLLSPLVGIGNFDLSTVWFGPIEMERYASWLIDTFVSVSAEIIPLRL